MDPRQVSFNSSEFDVGAGMKVSSNGNLISHQPAPPSIQQSSSELLSPPHDEHHCPSTRHNQNEYQVYTSRWYILGMFAIAGIWQNLVYGTFGPIAQSAQPALQLTQTDLALLPNWYNIAYVISAFPYVWLVEIKGLRMPMTATMWFVAIGTGVRCLHTGDRGFDKVFLHAGQLINGFGAAVPWFACTHISAVWFPPRQRNLATAIGLFASGFGVSLAFLLGPAFINAFKGSGTPEEVYVAIYRLFYFEAIISYLLLFLTVFYFPSKPPTPPSFSATVQRFSYVEGFAKFFTNRNGWLVFIIYSTNTIFSSWNQFLSLNVQSVMDETEVGWLGFTMTAAAIVAGPPLAAVVDMKRVAPYSRIISMLFVGLACCCIAVFTVAANWQTHLLTKGLIWGTMVPAITLATSPQPIWWELCCDSVYPVPESIVSGIFSVGSCGVSLVFLVILMFPSLGVSWVNPVLLVAQLIIIPLLLVYRHDGRRSAADRAAEVESSANNEELPGAINETGPYLTLANDHE